MVPTSAQPFFKYRDEMTLQNGLVFKGTKIVVPESLRRDMIEETHKSHQRLQACLRRAREVFFWPGMSAQFKNRIGKCSICQCVRLEQASEPLQPHQVLDRPWQRVETDLLTFENRDYLVLVDYYSNFIELDHLADPSSQTVIHKLKMHFSRHGVPDYVVSDNGPQYTSSDFRRFAATWKFTHVTILPHYPKANGMAESAVKTCKTLMKRALLSQSDPYLGSLDHHNTPTAATGMSPCQRLFGRRTKTLLPFSESLLKTDQTVSDLLKGDRVKQAKHFDLHAKQLSELKSDPFMLRSQEKPEEQTTPGWSGFNTLTYPSIPLKTMIGYHLMIHAEVSNFSTLYTLMKLAQKICESMGQRDSVITFDLDLYAKAKQLQMKYPNEFKNTVIRMGGFHIALNYLAVLENLYAQSGLEDLLIESGVYVAGTTSVLMLGKSYNKGIRAQKLSMEALFRLLWQAFLEWLSKTLKRWLDGFLSCVKSLTSVLEAFRSEEREKSKAFCFWEVYINMVLVLLQFIKAERTGNWKLHLTATAAMVPHFFAMDRINYARWLPVYLSVMNMLETNHPEVYKEFINGNHSLKIKSFRSVAKITVMSTRHKEKISSVNADREIFGRLLVTAKHRDIDLKVVLSYELCSVPIALAHPDGTLRKTGTATFGELSGKYSHIVISTLSRNCCTRVDLVFDQYRPVSIKAGEGKERGESSSLEVKIHGETSPVPKQWTKFISHPKNKENLAAFLCDPLSQHFPEPLGPSQKVFLAGGFKDRSRTVSLTQGSVTIEPNLCSDHEEADTRLLLHAKHAATTYRRISSNRHTLMWPRYQLHILKSCAARSCGFEAMLKTSRDLYQSMPFSIPWVSFCANVCRRLMHLLAATQQALSLE
ncbi:Uncharacterized protein K02A2.6 [Stylophora pistillata]|uniref:Uncharacterized protein K02A2.6 n=1 Tax=Stylophora pistillata TaxID=50429 RepID=A0A2B4RF38_STYPI|nr:Uncharacterized protein K02A2.6 [Stylophora pistillata]